MLSQNALRISPNEFADQRQIEEGACHRRVVGDHEHGGDDDQERGRGIADRDPGRGLAGGGRDPRGDEVAGKRRLGAAGRLPAAPGGDQEQERRGGEGEQQHVDQGRADAAARHRAANRVGDPERRRRHAQRDREGD